MQKDRSSEKTNGTEIVFIQFKVYLFTCNYTLVTIYKS